MTEQKKSPGEGLRRQIDENLRRVYEAQVEEQLPERFNDLINRLRARDGENGSGK